MMRQGSSSFAGTDGISCESHMAPFQHVALLPSKNIRKICAEELNARWIHLPQPLVDGVVEVVTILHNASLVIDDIEDGSEMRRGAPAAHKLFGVALSINSANQAYFEAMQKAMDLPRAFVDSVPPSIDEKSAALRQHLSKNCAEVQLELMRIFTSEMIALHEGQGKDILWRDTLTCPTVEEYRVMAAQKTGGLFRLLLRLMMAFQPSLSAELQQKLISLVDRIGIAFQMIDDYLNATAPKYFKDKAHFEDLTEGKFSFPIIHSIRTAAERCVLPGTKPDRRLFHILRQHTTDAELKKFCVQLMEETGTFEFCRQEIARERREIGAMIAAAGGGGNTALTTMLDSLMALATDAP